MQPKRLAADGLKNAAKSARTAVLSRTCVSAGLAGAKIPAG
jgi:hypothetical protein